jgi:DNA-binding transcriptional LysR family regulator
MDLKSLRYFVAVAESESLGKAARRLNTAQPALSVRIRKLEQQIGAELFDRTSRGMQLTDAGSALYARAREALALAQEGVEAARAVAAGHRGRLTIGYMFALGYAMLPRLVPALRQAIPEVELQFVEMSARLHEQLLLEHKVDVALCMPPILHEEVRTVVVGSHPLRLALSTSSPLARSRSIPVSRLQGERLIALPAGPGGPDSSTVTAVLRRHGLSLQIAHRVETVHAALALVLAGEGIALLPACVAQLTPQKVVLRALQDVPERLEVAVCWRSELKLQSIDAVLAAARESF